MDDILKRECPECGGPLAKNDTILCVDCWARGIEDDEDDSVFEWG